MKIEIKYSAFVTYQDETLVADNKILKKTKDTHFLT